MADILDKSVRTPVGDTPVVPVLLMLLGGYLCWFGVHYWRSDTAYPTDPLKAVLTGKPIPTPDRSASEAAVTSIVNSAGGTTVGDTSGPGATINSSALTKEEIQALWIGNGGAPDKANLAAAIAMQESSGRAAVTSSNPDGGTNVGLWQLDTKGAGAGHTVKELQDPATNARITIMKSANGTNWRAWEAYTSGAYKKYL